MIDLHHVLANQYFFADLDSEQRQQLLAKSLRHSLRPGAHLFRQGDKAAAFYVVVQGRIKLYRLSPDGDERIMGMAQTSETFAEGILFMDPPRYPVNAQAMETTDLVAVDSRSFLDLLAGSFPTCLAVMSRMTRRIQGLLDEIESLTLQNSRERLVHFLLGLIPDHAQNQVSFRLPTRKSEIAARLSIQPETLSRLLRLLDGEGLIQMRGDTIAVPDVAALRAVVRRWSITA